MEKSELCTKEAFLLSLQRCFKSKSFIPKFYECFMSKSEEIRHFFRFTDFEKQNKMLERSLVLSAEVTVGTPESLRELNERSKTHDRDHLNVEPRFYGIWLEAIIETARDFDPEWNEAVEEVWRRILSHVIGHMARHY